MKLLRIALFLAANAAFTAPHPCYFEFERFGEIVRRVQADPSTTQEAFETLRAIADEQPWITSPTFCRAYAFEAIGRLGASEVIPYLEGISLDGLDNFDESDRREIARAVRYALYDSVLAQFSTDDEKAGYFEERLSEPVGYARSWALDRVCNTALLVAMPSVREAFAQSYSAEGAQYSRFCEARMRALATDPSRLAALAAVLTVSQASTDPELAAWAMRELMAMKLPSANAELERFEREVLSAPEEHPNYQRLIALADEIWAHLGFPSDRRFYLNGKERTMWII